MSDEQIKQEQHDHVQPNEPVPPPPRAWSPEPKQRNGIEPCPWRPGTHPSDIHSCWMDPNCDEYKKRGPPSSMYNFRKHICNKHGVKSDSKEWQGGWTNCWIDVEGRREQRINYNAIEFSNVQLNADRELDQAAKVAHWLKQERILHRYRSRLC